MLYTLITRAPLIVAVDWTGSLPNSLHRPVMVHTDMSTPSSTLSFLPPLKTTRTLLFAWIKYLSLMGGMGWLLLRGAEKLGYQWQWYRIPRYLFEWQEGQLLFGPLIQGVGITLKITAISLVLAFLVGLAAALARLSTSMAANAVSRIYLESVRNTPLLVQLFFIYFVLAPVLGMSGFTAAILSLSLFEGAYASEILRAGILSIPTTQWEAAYSMGLDTRQTYRLIVIPQAVRAILPPLTSQAISLVKDSALVSTIAIYDLTMQGQIIIAQTYLVFELWFTIAAIYLVITITLSLVVRYLELRLTRNQHAASVGP
jgi:polar amino acid transport system permease protein